MGHVSALSDSACADLVVCRLLRVDLRTNSGSCGALVAGYVRTAKTARAYYGAGRAVYPLPEDRYDAIDRIHRHPSAH